MARARRRNRVRRTEREKRYQQALNAEAELRLIREFEGAPDMWLRHARVGDPEVDEAGLNKAVRSRRARLEKLLQVGGFANESPRLRGNRQWAPGPPLPFEARGARSVGVRGDVIESMLNARTVGSCSIVLGRVTSSGFREYAWAVPTRPATGDVTFSPIDEPLLPAGELYGGDWEGRTGAHFSAYLSVPAGWPDGAIDSVGEAGVFQFTFPPPACDSDFSWWTFAVVELLTLLAFDEFRPTELGGTHVGGRDEIDFTSEWVIHESPEGSGFPVSLLDDYEFEDRVWFYRQPIPPPKWPEGHLARPREVLRTDSRQLGGSFRVSAGVSPTIYVGLSLFMQGSDGYLSTGRAPTRPPAFYEGSPLSDYYEFVPGVSYCYTPVGG